MCLGTLQSPNPSAAGVNQARAKRRSGGQFKESPPPALNTDAVFQIFLDNLGTPPKIYFI